MRDDAARIATGRSGGTCRIGRGAELARAAVMRDFARQVFPDVPADLPEEGKGLDGSSALDTGWAAVHWAGERVSGRGACVWSRARRTDGQGGDGAAGGRHDKCQASVNRSGALFGTAISTSLGTRGDISEPQLARLVVCIDGGTHCARRTHCVAEPKREQKQCLGGDDPLVSSPRKRGPTWVPLAGLLARCGPMRRISIIRLGS
jgi:hypothetical protein